MRFFILYLLLLCITKSPAQNWNWVESFGGPENEAIYTLKPTSEGDIVGVGNYSGIANFGNEMLEAISGSDAFLMKVNDLGEVQWVVSGGSSSNDLSYDVEVDNEGNIIWLGSYWVNGVFENETISPVTGSLAFFLAKYNSEGQLLWVNSIDGNQLKFVNDVVVDDSNDLYLTGFFRDSLIVDDIVLESEIDEDAFVLKISSEGTALWGRQYGELGTIRPEIIEINNEGDLVIGGIMTGTVTFGSDVLTSVNTDYDIFIARLTSNGDPIWGTIGTGVFDNDLNGLEIDQEDQIYVTGSFEGVMNVSGESIQTPGNINNLYLLKLTSAGDLVWIRGLDDQEFNEQSTSFSLAILADQIFITGHFLNELIIDNLEIIGDGQLKAYLASFDVMTGVVEQLYLIPGTSQTIGIELLVDNEDRFYLAGLYLGDLLLGDQVLTSEGATDFFIAKASENFTSIAPVDQIKANIKLYPSPVLDQLYIESDEPVLDMKVFDPSGRLILSTQQSQSINVSLLPAGYYIIKLKAGQISYAFSFIKR